MSSHLITLHGANLLPLFVPHFDVRFSREFFIRIVLLMVNQKGFVAISLLQKSLDGKGLQVVACIECTTRSCAASTWNVTHFKDEG